MYDETTMRKRFDELGQKRAAVEAAAKPVRERYEAIIAREQQARAEARVALNELKPLEAPLFEIDNERAMIVRALKGQVG